MGVKYGGAGKITLIRIGLLLCYMGRIGLFLCYKFSSTGSLKFVMHDKLEIDGFFLHLQVFLRNL